MKKNLSRTAIAVVGIIGSINISSSSIGYFDESDSVAGNSRHIGWSLGLSEAIASNDDHSIDDGTEIIEIIGDPTDPDPIWDDPGYDDGAGGGSDEGGDGGGSGGGSGDDSGENEPSERDKCLVRVGAEFTTCMNSARENFEIESQACYALESDSYQETVICEMEYEMYYLDDQEKCTGRLSDDEQYCRTYFSA